MDEKSLFEDQLFMLWILFRNKYQTPGPSRPNILPKEELPGLELNPPVDTDEYAIFLAYVLALEAVKYLEQDSHKQNIIGLICFLYSNEAFEHWFKSRSLHNCRKPSESLLKMYQDHDDQHYNVWKKKDSTEQGKKAAEARHSKPGGSREKRAKIQELWASGKYQSRDICVEQEAAALGMSLSTARKALIGTPDPKPPESS